MPDHRSLEAWKEARIVVVRVAELSRDHWRPWAAAIFVQLQRSSLSVQLNIAEGWSFSQSPTWAAPRGIAYGSAVETADLIALPPVPKLVPAESANPLREHSLNRRRLLVGL